MSRRPGALLRAVLLSVAMLLSLLPTAGCGYKAGWLEPEGVDTIAVDVMKNHTFRRGLEFDLTARVVEEIQSRSGLRIATREHADWILDGEILDVQQRVLSETDRDDVFEANLTVQCRFRVRNRHTGSIVKEFDLSDSGQLYNPRAGIPERLTNQVFVDLARRVVDHLEAGF